MSKRKTITSAVVAVGIFASVGYTAVAQRPPRPTPAQTQTTPQNTLGRLDRQFIIEATQGGTAEVVLGQLAAKRATNPQVRQYGQRMVQDHTRANRELLQLATRKGVTPPPPTDLGKYEVVRARLLQVPSTSFDELYMAEAGLNQHLENVAVHQRQSLLGEDQDLRAYAARVLPTLQEHLQMAAGMTGNTSGGDNQNPGTTGGGNQNRGTTGGGNQSPGTTTR